MQLTAQARQNAVDPRTHPGRVSQTPDSANAGEGRPSSFRPKSDASDGRTPGIDLNLGITPADANSLAWKDLRQSPRIRCSGSAEFRIEGSDEHLWGTLTDISLHGCYVEVNSRFPVGTTVYLVLKSLGARIQTRGTVRTSFPSIGMGISFSEIEPGQQHHLQLLVDTLTGANTVSRIGMVRGISEKSSTGAVDPIAFLDEITEFFRKKQLLSREEFQQIANRVRRP